MIVMSEDPKFYTTAEVASLLKMNPQVIARKLQKGEIVAYKIGKDWRISEKELYNWLEQHSNQLQRDPGATVVKHFTKNGRIKALPAQRKKRQYVLEHILRRFEIGRVYSEKEVNEIIGELHEDFCTVRREFIMNKMMSRSGGKYMRHSSYIFQK
jgi:excisionase family DNA binding protein